MIEQQYKKPLNSVFYCTSFPLRRGGSLGVAARANQRPAAALKTRLTRLTVAVDIYNTK